MQPAIQHPIPLINFPYPSGHSSTKSQEKELSCRQSFSSKLVQNITILYIFYQNFSGEDAKTPSFHIVQMYKPA